jgi:branched-chain amino acid transport system ATP-binding protein
MLAIARGFLSAPKILMLDEPSLGIAPLMRDTIFQTVLRIYKERQLTLLLVEQNALAAAEFADRTYVLRTGSIELAGTRDELLAKADFEEAYLGFEAVTR